MQRSRHDAGALRRGAALLLLLALYEPLTTLFSYLPPLLAFGAWRFFFAGHWLERAAWAGYFYLFEVDHSLAPLSLIITLGIYVVMMRRLYGFVACEGCLYFAGVAIFYGAFLGVHLFYTHVLGIENHLALGQLLIYLVWDLVLFYAI